MFESLCHDVHAKLIAGRCPWCGCSILGGKAIDPRMTAFEYARDQIREAVYKQFPHWRLENGWIRRKYKTASWKGTLSTDAAGRSLLEARSGARRLVR